ncbi:hypothetical protein AWZ03_001710 [Drosophila navojoa]|uniref:Uncharacterized protein n=1 Tax=Drosophila navojoa TaxID=7232 RepID=A0A484BVC8_DRONA|nr:hypothetical protein AWZ03_001710 [Drosophila navojoa]
MSHRPDATRCPLPAAWNLEPGHSAGWSNANEPSHRPMPTVHSHVISSIVLCLPHPLLRLLCVEYMNMELDVGLRLGLGLALLINTSSAG